MTETKYGEGSDSQINVSSDSDNDSDDSTDDSTEQSDMELAETDSEDSDVSDGNQKNDEDNDEEEEDEVIKAIKYEREKPREHPPNILCPDDVVEISFHPCENLLAVATIVGDVLIYEYSNESNELKETFELHCKACRDIEFDSEGKLLFSTSKDRTIMVTDMTTGKLVKNIEGAHNSPIYSIKVIDDRLFATGDDNGVIKLWDVRSKAHKSILTVAKNEDYISDMITNEEKKYLICASGDGSITTIDLVNRQYRLQSEEYDEELTCLGLFRMNTKLLAGTSNGRLYVFNWNEFGLHSDRFPGPKSGINSMIPITENIVVTACEDGILRATHLFPHRHLGVVGQHEYAAEKLDICNNGTFIASCGVSNEVKFWNVQYFENIDVSRKAKNKKSDLKNHLPSSKQKNASDFFAGLQE